MKMTNEMIVLAWVFVALGPATLIRVQPGDEEVGRMEAMEKVLREAEIEKADKTRRGKAPFRFSLKTASGKRTGKERSSSLPTPRLSPTQSQRSECWRT